MDEAKGKWGLGDRTASLRPFTLHSPAAGAALCTQGLPAEQEEPGRLKPGLPEQTCSLSLTPEGYPGLLTSWRGSLGLPLGHLNL